MTVARMIDIMHANRNEIRIVYPKEIVAMSMLLGFPPCADDQKYGLSRVLSDSKRNNS